MQTRGDRSEAKREEERGKMGGFFGVVSKGECFDDLFYGTDYHFHLGTENAGLATFDGKSIQREIHGIAVEPLRPQFIGCKQHMKGKFGIGVISDYEPEPLIIHSHLGTYAIVHVGVVRNLDDLVTEVHQKRGGHFSEMSGSRVNPTELMATLVNQGSDFVEGLKIVQDRVEGSSSVMLLTKDGIYVSRDKFGRTPIVIGTKPGSTAATLETNAFPNLGYKIDRYLGPGEIGLITGSGYEQLAAPGDVLQICTFLWIYFGFPGSHYEGINVETSRYRTGAALAERDIKDGIEVDYVAGIPDSGTGHGLGYAGCRKLAYKRPYVKYTPTWPRSFMPAGQATRDTIADMKLIPIDELIKGQRIVFCEDSIVRGTQLKKKVRELFAHGAAEVHMRPACPPLTEPCAYLNFSRTASVFDLAARKVVRRLEGRDDADIAPYLDESSSLYEKMVEGVKEDLGLTSLKYQKLDDMVRCIGLPKEKLCTYCWTGK